MNKKRIRTHLQRVFDNWVQSIKNPEVAQMVRNNTIITGGAIASLLKVKTIYFLPRDNGKSADQVVVYGGGGLIRYNFFNKVYKDFILDYGPHKIYTELPGIMEEIGKISEYFLKGDLSL